jgi:urease accessory protein
MSDYTTYREVLPFLHYAGFRHAGAPGKCGSLFLAFERDAMGRSYLRTLDRRAPLIVQQALYFDAEMPLLPCVYILSGGGPNVDGDRYRQHFSLGPGAMAYISTGAATKLAEMEHNYARLTQLIELADEAYLEYLPEPIIPCRHARYVSHTVVRVAPTATLAYGEILAAGRRHYGVGERFAYDVLSLTCRVERPDGSLLYRDKMVLSPSERHPDSVGTMEGYEVLGSLLILTPPAVADRLWAEIGPQVTQGGAPLSLCRLPGGAGLQCRLLGHTTAAVKTALRQLCSRVRMAVKGKPLPPEFPWR